MLIHVRSLDFALTDAIRRHVEYRVESMLGLAGRRIQDVVVRLGDVNAQRGGIDKRCHIAVRCPRYGTLVATAIDEDLYLAIDQAVTKVRKNLLHHLGKDLAQERQTSRRELVLR